MNRPYAVLSEQTPDTGALLRDFVAAYQTLEAAALNDPNRLTTPSDDGENLVARFTGLDASIALVVRTTKPNLMHRVIDRWRRPGANNDPLDATVEVTRHGDNTITRLGFTCLRTGGQITDPVIKGDQQRIDRDGKTPITSNETLRKAAGIVIAATPHATMLTFEQPGQNLYQSMLVGNERRKIHQAFNQLDATFPLPKASKRQASEDVIATNDQHRANPNRITFIRATNGSISIHVNAKDQGSSELPPLIIKQGMTSGKKGELPEYYIYDHGAQKAPLYLSRAQREILVAMLADTNSLHPANFGHYLAGLQELA